MRKLLSEHFSISEILNLEKGTEISNLDKENGEISNLDKGTDEISNLDKKNW